MLTRPSMILMATISIASFPGIGSAQEVDPVQAISAFYEAQRNILGYTEGDSTSKHWLSLSIVGAVADAADPASINDLANFCPTESPVIQSYSRARKLDRIYSVLINNMVGPVRSDTDDVLAARKLLQNDDLTNTDLYVRYLDYLSKFNSAEIAYRSAENAEEVLRARQEMNRIEDEWSVNGGRDQVDAALYTIQTAGGTFSRQENQKRRQTLEDYRLLGIPYDDDTTGAYVSPRSYVSPKVEDWEQKADWVKVSFSDELVTTYYSATSSQSRGFGGLNVGFLMVGGTGGGGNSTEVRNTDVRRFSYSFEIARVMVRRPWLDTEVLYQPLAWTWRKNAGTPNFPRVSAGPDADGIPRADQFRVYDNLEIDCTLLPTEFIIARNRSLTATVSKDTYDMITSSGASSSGGGAFGIFGGKKTSWTTTTVNESDSDVTFTVSADGVAVIGMISEKLPALPDPNKGDVWPEDAWLDE